MTDERVIYRGKLHWWWLVRPACLVAIGLVGVIAGVSKMGPLPSTTTVGTITGQQAGAIFCFCLPAGLILGLGLLIWLLVLLAVRKWQLVVTDRRVICRWGLLSKNVRELMLEQLESVELHVPLLGRILGYGTVIFCGSGGTRIPMTIVSDAESVREAVHRARSGERAPAVCGACGRENRPGVLFCRGCGRRL